MKYSTKAVVLWSPRVLAILFALFISLFAFDVFDGKSGILETLIGFAIHLIPTGIIVIAIILSWHREWIGGIVFIFLPIFYIYSTWGRFPLSVYLIMCTPPMITGILYFVNWKIKRDDRGKGDTV
ncbi:MAG: DUF7670 domain-containing protein [Bacteroidota bacterium]